MDERLIKGMFEQLLQGQNDLRNDFKNDLRQLREDFEVQLKRAPRAEFIHAEVADPDIPMESGHADQLMKLAAMAKDKNSGILRPLKESYPK